ncbi:MAG: dihydrolipoyllysine-residue acetyltransferase [Chromatiales bacterium]|nr:dihydrolipoyllysine-residue acetyltransferase [Chromatiales bacterium]
MSNTREVRVPDIGDFSEVEIVEVMVAAGDTVQAEDPLITLETDKAAMEVPSPAAGRIKSLKVSQGDRVSQGDLILELETAGDTEAVSGEDQSEARSGGEQASPDERPEQHAAGETAAGGASAGSSDRAPVSRDEEVCVPDLGDVSEADIAELLVSEGDQVEREQPLITLESDKAAMDVPSPVAGRVKSIRVSAGGKVGAGDLIMIVETRETPAGGSGPAPGDDRRAASPAAKEPAASPQASGGPQAPADPVSAPAPVGPALPAIDEPSFARAHASPSVRKFARELGVDLGRVRGSGPKGRILAENVKAFVKAVMSGQAGTVAGAALPQVPRIDHAKFGEIEEQALTRVQKISGPRLHASWVNIPHVTQHDEADITGLEARRLDLKQQAAEAGVRLTPLAFIIRACVLALGEFPQFNASLSDDGAQLVLKKYCNVGFAADTPQGLVVPVIRDADSKSVFEIAATLADLSERAREGKLKGDEMRGGSFTVSSLGGLGGGHFTPLINAPEVAILGAGRAAMRPVWQEGQFVPRLILPLSLSYDHRVIDGANGVRFTSRLVELLGDVERLLES